MQNGCFHLLFYFALTSLVCAKEELPLSRVIENRDGTTAYFKRDPQNTTLEKKTYMDLPNGEKSLQSRTIYKRDKFLNLRSGSIYDGQKTKIFRIVYGYHRKTGQLVAENLYDVRVRYTDPKNPNIEMPVRQTRYTYDGQGHRSKPLVFTSQKGKRIRELLRWFDKQKVDGKNDVDIDPLRKAAAAKSKK